MYESGADNGWTVVSGDTFVVLPFAAAVSVSEADPFLHNKSSFQEFS